MKNISMHALALAAVGAAVGLSVPTEAKAETPHATWIFRSKHDNRCLDADTREPPGKRGARVQMWDCNGSPQQQWDAYVDVRVNNGVYSYRLVNRYSGTCLDRPWLGNGSPVYLWPCHGGLQQAWYLIPPTFGNATMTLNAPDNWGFALDNDLTTPGNGGIVHMWSDIQPTPPQQEWFLDYPR